MRLNSFEQHKLDEASGLEMDRRAPGFADPPFAVRVDKLGRRLHKPPEFTRDQLDHIRHYYETTPPDLFNQSGLAKSLGKSRQNVARIARKMGLTKRGRPLRPDVIAKTTGKPKWKDKPHPRGMAGKKHSAETLKIVSETSKRSWSTWKTFGTGPMSAAARAATSRRMQILAQSKPASANFTRAKGGHRSDLDGIYFRSSWEANYARYLNFLMKFGVVEKWEFEPETFWFDGIRRGATSYKPDFRIKYKGDDRLEYVEIKGWVVPKDRTKWSRMKKYHPTVKLVVVGAKQYYAIQKKWASAIPTWETQKSAIRVSRETKIA